VIKRALSAAPLLGLALVLAGCAAGMAFRRGEEAARRADWDAAVVHYREAVQSNPGRPEFRIALERAMLAASRVHLQAAHEAEARGELDAAVREYRRAAEYDGSNRQAAAKVAELDQVIRERIEASRPKAPIERMRERARRVTGEAILNPTQPLASIHFNNQSVREILNFIGTSSGINIVFSNDYQDRAYTIHLDDATLEQALQQVLSANQLFHKVLNERSILVLPDTPQNRARHEEQVVRTFFLSHADATEVAQLLNQVLRVPGLPVIPTIAPNKTRNTITVRATSALVAIMERVIEANDRPPAEVVLDINILEVNRQRAKQFGLDLGQYSITGTLSPDGPPTVGTDGSVRVPPFPASSLRGISTGDLFLSVPQAIVRFLESDTQTRLVAKPQLRGQEGQEIKLNLGDRIPVINTTFGSLGGPGSIATQPISSYQYEDIGVNVTMTPRVTLEGDVVLSLVVESSTLGNDISVGGQSFPTFGNRSIETRIRLRDGESTLLAGLLREDSRKAVRGIIGLMRLPGFRQLFSSNDNSVQQTDIIMLLTPRIVRTQEYTAQDLAPIFIGTQSNLGLSGPPPLIGQPAAAPADAAPGGAGQTPQAVPGQTVPPTAQVPPTQGGVGVAPPGSSQVPGPAVASAGQVLMSVPGPEFRLGGGPYLVPVSITGASQLSGVTLTVTYNPAVVRLVNVQEGSFMRAGGVGASFSQQPDPVAGRVDIAIVRRGDLTGVAGTGLLAGLLFESVGTGPANLAVTGSATGPNGSPVSLQFAPVATVRVP